jgi:class 3 adenylate cyclase/predicted ATPase
MFCDLVGSTALSASLDPEDLRAVIGAYHDAVRKTVAGFDGFVAKYMGDGVLVYFGYPRAHEDDAERAIRAGLALIDAIGRLDVGSANLQARVGIATGPVVVGDLIGEGPAQEHAVVGEAPNLAARLQALAEPNAVVIAAGTRRLIGDLFECRDLGTIEVKGIAGSVPVWRVLRASGVASRFEALRGPALTRRGLALVPGPPDGDQRRERELDLQITLGHAMNGFRGSSAPEAGEAYSRAGELASTLNRPRVLLAALWGQWLYHNTRAELEQARQLAARLRELGETTGDAPTQVLGFDASGYTCFHLGEFTAGRAYQDQALALYDPADRASFAELKPNDTLVQMLVHSCLVLACLGHLDQVLFRRDAALKEARRLSHPQTLALALASAWATWPFARMEPGSLLPYADESLAITIEHELGFFRALALAGRGWCLAASGRADQGIQLVNEGLARLDESGLKIWRPWALMLLGDACRIAGQYQPALAHIAAARRLAEETGARWSHAETSRLTGEALLAIGDRSGAEASYREAIAIPRQQSAKLWELCAAMSLARLWRDQGKRREACDLLAPVCGWFTEGFGTPVLQQERALLDQLT